MRGAGFGIAVCGAGRRAAGGIAALLPRHSRRARFFGAMAYTNCVMTMDTAGMDVASDNLILAEGACAR